MNKQSAVALRRTILVAVALVILIIVGYPSYEFISYQSLKDQCLGKIADHGRNVSIYFDKSDNGKIPVAFENDLSQIPNVEKVSLTSSEDALASFKQRHINDPLTLQALKELGTNPLGPSVTVTFSDFEKLKSSQDTILKQIETLLAQSNLTATKIDSQVDAAERGLQTFKQKSFISDVASGAYYAEKHILELCANQEDPTN